MIFSPSFFLGVPNFLKIYFCFLKFIIFIFSVIFISWRLITSQHCSGFSHTLTWISHGVTCIPHPDPPSHLPLKFIFNWGKIASQWCVAFCYIINIFSCCFLGAVICLFMAVLGLCCCPLAFSNCSEWELPSSCGAQALISVWSFSCCGARAPVCRLSNYAQELSCLKACGIFPGSQESNPCPLHWQVGS